MSISQQYQQIINHLPAHVQLVAVSKTHPVELIREVYDLGQRKFGENKVQEILAKAPQLPDDVEWHLIGHLQTNKVRQVLPYVTVIESIDSEKLLYEINKEASKINKKINCLLQVKIAEEDSKYGLTETEALEIIQKYQNQEFPFINIIGLMGMATFTDNKAQVKNEFSRLKKFFDSINEKLPVSTLSMGMSDDHPLAIESGSTSVRIGSAIFGHRDYSV